MSWEMGSFLLQIVLWLYLIRSMHITLKARKILNRDVDQMVVVKEIFDSKKEQYAMCLKETMDVLKRLAMEEGVARDDIRLEILAIIDKLPRADELVEEDTNLH